MIIFKQCQRYSFALFLYVILESNKLFVAGNICTVQDAGGISTFRCKTFQKCCGSRCCNEAYTYWYIWVIVVISVIICCCVTIIIRKKKQQKNRISHSRFLEHLRARAAQEEERAQQADIQQQQQQDFLLQQPTHAPHFIYNEPVVSYHMNNQSVGIGGSPSPYGLFMTPVDEHPSPLLANRAPPPYSPRPDHPGSNHPPHIRNDQPPSYDSIFS